MKTIRGFQWPAYSSEHTARNRLPDAGGKPLRSPQDCV